MSVYSEVEELERAEAERDQAIRERDEAREVAFEFWLDLPYMGDYLFEKHHGTDLEEYPWLASMVEERIPKK